MHFAARDAVITRLVAALKPGGWLVVEDFDSALPHCLDPLRRAAQDAGERRGLDPASDQEPPEPSGCWCWTQAGCAGLFAAGGRPLGTFQPAEAVLGDCLVGDLLG
ncbi:MAG TPA: hypothetical protein VMV92_38350 [Streptosporangiaceae bacterium]|nr:hypothetical protein [Streptosporangiaceae bacterium]